MESAHTVIVCDDHVDIRRELAATLEEHGLKVYRARSGREAIKWIKWGSGVGVVVLDLRMPGKMDGIETAEKIQTEFPAMRKIFLTAYDNQDYRNRAAEAELAIERWIDKGPDFLDKTEYAVLEALGRNFANEISNRLGNAAQTAGIAPEQLEAIRHSLALHELVPPPYGLPTEPKQESEHQRMSSTRELPDVLNELTYTLDEAWLGYSDAAHRQFAWDSFREVTFNHLWESVEPLVHDEYRQQLAVQLEKAVRKIEAPSLTQKHLRAVHLTLERLCSERVGQHDVDACKKAWRQADIETLPSFKDILAEWAQLYRAEGPEDETEEESTTGKNNTIAPRSE